jgi:aspartate 1-decarboxylase
VLRQEINAMYISLLKSKLHRARVTGADISYQGSITISADLAELAGLQEYERILAGNTTNGQRFETYTIFGTRGRGIIELNGATAHLGEPGDVLTIMSFGWYDIEDVTSHTPKVILLDAQNRAIQSQKEHRNKNK